MLSPPSFLLSPGDCFLNISFTITCKKNWIIFFKIKFGNENVLIRKFKWFWIVPAATAIKKYVATSTGVGSGYGGYYDTEDLSRQINHRTDSPEFIYTIWVQWGTISTSPIYYSRNGFSSVFLPSLQWQFWGGFVTIEENVDCFNPVFSSGQ